MFPFHSLPDKSQDATYRHVHTFIDIRSSELGTLHGISQNIRSCQQIANQPFRSPDQAITQSPCDGDINNILPFVLTIAHQQAYYHWQSQSELRCCQEVHKTGNSTYYKKRAIQVIIFFYETWKDHHCYH